MVFDLCYASSSLLAANGFSFTKLTYKIPSGFFNETKNRPIALFTTIFCIMSLAPRFAGLIAKKGFDSRIDIDNEFAVEALIFLAFALFAVKPLLTAFFWYSFFVVLPSGYLLFYRFYFVKPHYNRIPRWFLYFFIEAPRSPASAGRGIFDRKEVCYFQIRSLTPQSRSYSGTGNALAFAVQLRAKLRSPTCPLVPLPASLCLSTGGLQ